MYFHYKQVWRELTLISIQQTTTERFCNLQSSSPTLRYILSVCNRLQCLFIPIECSSRTWGICESPNRRARKLQGCFPSTCTCHQIAFAITTVWAVLGIHVLINFILFCNLSMLFLLSRRIC